MKYLDGKLSVTRMVVAAVLTVCAASAQTPTVKAVGTVKSVSGNSVVLTTDSGEQSVTFADSARTMRAESAKVTDCSPLSVVKTTELPLTDLTVPTALTVGVCADAAQTVNTAATTIRVTLSFPSKYFMTVYYQLNHAAWR